MNQNTSTFIKRSTTLVAAAFIALNLVFITNIQSVTAAAPTFPNAATDDDANAVLRGGTKTAAELNQKYDGNASAQVIFSYFGISAAEVNTMDATAVAGHVTKDGRVFAGNKQVATGALTAGRENITGSTRVVSQNVTFYTRTPSVSFRQDKLEAFVVLNKNQQFEYAVLVACGNPVKATNTVEAPKPAPAPAPAPKPAPTPAPVAPVVTPVVTPNPAPAAPAPAPAPVQTVVAAPAPTQLVAAGPASAVGLFAGTSLVAAAGHALFTRNRRES